MSFFRLSTHHRSNTTVTDDQAIILAVVAELMKRRKLALVVPDPMTREEYDAFDDGTPEEFDPINIANWIEIIPGDIPG